MRNDTDPSPLGTGQSHSERRHSEMEEAEIMAIEVANNKQTRNVLAMAMLQSQSVDGAVEKVRLQESLKGI